MTRQYFVEAIWDAEAGVFYAKSNVPGLNVETATIEAFIEVVKDVAPELIEANEPLAESGSVRSMRLQTDLALA